MRILISSVLLILTTTIAHSADVLNISDPWIREVPPVSTVSAVYLRIENTGEEDDRLTGVSSNASRFTEIHKTRIDENNIATMEMVDYLTIPAGKTTELKPGGSHIMLRELINPLKKGDIVLINLIFEKAGTKSVEARVR